MSSRVSLRLSGDQYAALRKHLFPGDGKEAMALLLCGRHLGQRRQLFTAARLVLVPYEECIREPYGITWQTERLVPLLLEASKKRFAVVKLHSHPGGLRSFSTSDDASDRELFSSIFGGWVEDGLAHGSAVMTPDGAVFGRAVDSELSFTPFECVSVAGDDLHFFWDEAKDGSVAPSTASHAQAFGERTVGLLKRLSVGIVGCSGTGSPTIEQLARLGAGELVLVDPDRMEERNLNRVLGSTQQDVKRARFKVHVLKDAVDRMGLGVRVDAFPEDAWCPEAVRRLAACDVLFGCLDSIDARHLLNKLATFYLVPYFDLGVKLVADGRGGVTHVAGTVHYLKPGGSSLLSRGVFTERELRAAALRRSSPGAYERERAEGYIAGVEVERPAVITLNMLVSALAVNDLLARLHPFRDEANGAYAVQRLSLSGGYLQQEKGGVSCESLSGSVGRGDVDPLLDLVGLNRSLPDVHRV